MEALPNPCHTQSPKDCQSSCKDSGKKKRGNRAAKLKQSKLDVRREQWLAQVSGKPFKPGQQRHPILPDGNLPLMSEKSANNYMHRGNDSNDEDSSEKEAIGFDLQCPKPLGKAVAGEGSATDALRAANAAKEVCGGASERNKEDRIQDISSISSSSNATGVSRSTGNHSTMNSYNRNDDAAEEEAAGGCGDGQVAVDDWEMVADALRAQASLDQQSPNKDQSTSESRAKNSDAQKRPLKPEYKYRSMSMGSRVRGKGVAEDKRAWRPDDSLRPPTLPMLSKHYSFSMKSARGDHQAIWGHLPSTPSLCPICAEELDVTDSSFVPCTCGFRLCLFCHHKISLDNGRCPGCRRLYNNSQAPSVKSMRMLSAARM